MAPNAMHGMWSAKYGALWAHTMQILTFQMQTIQRMVLSSIQESDFNRVRTVNFDSGNKIN